MALARVVLNDEDATGYARQDPKLLQFANDALDAIATHKDSEWLFWAYAEVTCVAGATTQEFNVPDSLGLVDVLNIKNGTTVTQCDRPSLDVFSPGWRSATPAAAEHWMPVADDRFKFQVYPPSPAGQILLCVHVRKPIEYAAIQTHTLPDSWTPVIAWYIIAMCDSMQDDHQMPSRSAQYMSMFYTALSQSKKIS